MEQLFYLMSLVLHTLCNSELKGIDYSDFLINNLNDLSNRDYTQDLKRQQEWLKIVENEKNKTLLQLKEIIDA